MFEEEELPDEPLSDLASKVEIDNKRLESIEIKPPTSNSKKVVSI